MEDIVGIILLLCLAVVGYLLYCGAKALLLCIVPVLCGLALGYYCLIGIRSVLFWTLSTSPLAYIRPKLLDRTLSFDFSHAALHGLNQLAGVLAGVFTGLLVFVVEAYTQAFESAFEGSPTLKYVGMAVAWALPLCVWAWVRSGGGTNRWYEKIVESSLKRRGFLGSRLMSALKELDGIESAIEQVSDEIGISWETKYRDAVEEYIDSHPELLADSRPADAVVRMTLQLARNDREGLRSCNALYQRAMNDFQVTRGLLTSTKNPILLDKIEGFDACLRGAKEQLLPKREWQEFRSFIEEVMKQMENLRHNASPHGDSDAGDSATEESTWPTLGQLPTDPYELLGVQPGCTRQELKDARNKKLDEWHPDKYPNAPLIWAKLCNDVSAHINEAYDKVYKELKNGSGS